MCISFCIVVPAKMGGWKDSLARLGSCGVPLNQLLRPCVSLNQPGAGAWFLERGLRSPLPYYGFKEEQIDSSEENWMLVPKKGK